MRVRKLHSSDVGSLLYEFGCVLHAAAHSETLFTASSTDVQSMTAYWYNVSVSHV